MTPRPSSPELKIRARLNDLQANLTAAVNDYRVARDLSSRPWELAQRVTKDLADHQSAVAFKQKDADPEESIRLTNELLTRISEEGLHLVLLDPKRPAAGLKLVDPSLSVLVTAAEEKAHRAAAERDAFANEHRALLNAADDKQKVSAVATALTGSDPAALRAALDGLPASKSRPTALTTHDLQEAALK